MSDMGEVLGRRRTEINEQLAVAFALVIRQRQNAREVVVEERRLFLRRINNGKCRAGHPQCTLEK
jgi:hypothetical protein